MFALPARRAVASALTVAALALFTATAASAQPWTNPNQPALTRANELLSQLSTDQQIQLALGNFAALQSFGVPLLNFQDGPDGIRNPGTTAMPSGQTIAATFNRALAYAYGQVVGSEARGEGFSEWTGPAVDIDRTPLAGRQPEAEGEDPFLSGNTAAQIVAGAKSQHVIVTLKHYTAYNQDYGRIGFDSIGSPATDVMVSERALQEIYEEPFRIVNPAGRPRLGDVLLQPDQRPPELSEPARRSAIWRTARASTGSWSRISGSRCAIRSPRRTPASTCRRFRPTG